MMAMLLLAEDYVREGFGTREFFNQTTVHPLAAAVLAALCFLTLVLPRKWMLLPALTLACMIPQGQRIVVATLDFNFLRVILLFAAARVFVLPMSVDLRGWRDFGSFDILTDPRYIKFFINYVYHIFLHHGIINSKGNRDRILFLPSAGCSGLWRWRGYPS